MKICIVYPEARDISREAESWKEEFERWTGKKIERIDPESREGESYCTARGITQYPAIVVAKEDDDKVSQLWQGKPLPLFDDVMAYL